MLSIIVGIIGVVLGVAMVWKSEKFLEMIGEQAWMNKVFGEGRGTTGYKMVGIIIIFVSFMIMFGLVEEVLMAIFGSIS